MRGCALWKVVRNLVHKKLKNRGAKFRATPTLVGHAPMLKHYPLGLGLCLSLEWMQPLLFICPFRACACSFDVSVTWQLRGALRYVNTTQRSLFA